MSTMIAPAVNSAVCYIVDDLGQGSGVLISPDCVLTAAHVVRDAYGPVTTANIRVTPGYSSGTSIYGSYAVSAFSSYLVSILTAVDSEKDFAILHLSTPVVGARPMTLSADTIESVVSLTGYPEAANGIQINSSQMVSNVVGYTLIQFKSLGSGASGGPIWAGSEGNSHVIGIMSSAMITSPEIGFAGLITADIAKQIENWVSLYDAPAATPSAKSGPGLEIDIPLQITPERTVMPAVVYRFVDTVSGVHFFTASSLEAATVVTSGTFTQEKNNFGEVPLGSSDKNSSPVYRFFDTHEGGHILTASDSERDMLIDSRQDLVFEGVALHEHAVAQIGDQAVYRFFDSITGGRFFSADSTKVHSALSNSSLTYEGIAFYAPSCNT